MTPPTSRSPRLVPLAAVTTAAALLLAGCADDAAAPAQDDPDEQPEPPDEPDDDPPTDDPGLGEVDEEQAVEEAEQLLGTPEDQIEQDERTRIMRRGDEQLAGTMDLRPGRRNLELDDDGTGTYVVTRVVIEMDGDDLVVE